MSATVIARRYAEAIADVAIERGLVEQIDRELRAFAQMISGSDELRNVFSSPIVSQRDKGKVLEALITRVNPGEYTRNLLRGLLRNYRLHHMQLVYTQFQRIINERRGILVAHVTTAAPMNEADQGRLGRKLQELTGKQVEFQFKTDPSLIGGVVTRLGSVIYYGSVITQLLEVKQRLKSGE